MKKVKNQTLKGLGIAVATATAMGVSTQASADVYGAGYLLIEDLVTEIDALGTGPSLYTFEASAQATLNGASAPGTSPSCGGIFLNFTTCNANADPAIVLSGDAQNAPGATNGVVRGEGDYTLYGGAGEYSNSESEIIDAQLLLDPSTSVGQIAETNLQGGFIGNANAGTGSTTTLSLTFEVSGQGNFAVSFIADWLAAAEVNGGSVGQGTGSVAASLVLRNDTLGQDVVGWAPNGTNGGVDGGITVCAAGLTCSSTEAGNLNVTESSGGIRAETSGLGGFSLAVSGLTTGSYTLGLTATVRTLAGQVPVPVPGTLLLMGVGLLAAAGVTRRKQA